MSLASPFWEICVVQNKGARDDQQDECGAWLSSNGQIVLAVLADGAGGHHNGARAAKLAVQAARRLWESEPPSTADLDLLHRLSAAAHQAIHSELSGVRSARATWVALLSTPSEACWVHSGDSRLYHLAKGTMISRTRDHSVAQVLVDQGKITPQDVPNHPDRSTLLQSLGGAEYLPVEDASASLQGDDIFLLCTDGFWNYVTDDELLKLGANPAEIEEKRLEGLVSQAVQRAGTEADNSSLLCVHRR